MTSPLVTFPGEALARLFRHGAEAGEAAAFCLPGGAALFVAGDPSDHLYLLHTGRLAALRTPDEGSSRLVGVILPGEPAGEMALIAGLPHSGDVIALRDCELSALPREAVFRAIERDPGLMTELARLMLRRARPLHHAAAVGEPSSFGFVGLHDGLDVRGLVEAVARAIRAQGYNVAVVGAEARGETSEWFSNLERDRDFVLYAGEAREIDWKPLMCRQVDRLVRVASGARPPGDGLDLAAGAALDDQRLADLILIQAPDCAAPRGSPAWTALVAPSRLFQIREGSGPDAERLARVLIGRAVGLVLSGRAARAYAHIGAIRALKARGVPIDFVAGVSMGAVIAGGLAMGWDEVELDHRIRKAFVDTSPLDDIAFPLLAMTHGRKVRARLAEHFGDRQICDLWLPFFCLSTNLTTGHYQLHRQGVLRDALTASAALPGVLPPWVQGADVLVDGAVINNFPADIMRAIQSGPIVGVDVSRGRSIAARDVTPRSLWRWMLSGHWRRGPPIVSLLMRAATLSPERDLLAAHEATDLLILPMVDDIEVRDWKAYGPAVAVGEAAAHAALDTLATPVTELRRRLSMRDAALAARPA